MPDSLASSPVRPLLDRLFQAARADDTHWASVRERHPDGFAGLSAREQADAYAELYIPAWPTWSRSWKATPWKPWPASPVRSGSFCWTAGNAFTSRSCASSSPA